MTARTGPQGAYLADLNGGELSSQIRGSHRVADTVILGRISSQNGDSGTPWVLMLGRFSIQRCSGRRTWTRAQLIRLRIDHRDTTKFQNPGIEAVCPKIPTRRDS